MQLLVQYVNGLMQAIYSGSNVRMMVGEHSVSILSITIDEAQRRLSVGYIVPEKTHEQFVLVPARTIFTTTFDDYPNLLQRDGWE